MTPASEELPVWRIAEPERRILFIAHGGTNSVTICHLLGMRPTPWEWDRLYLNHASITRLEAIAVGDDHTFSLIKLSDVEHLPLASRTR
jgi:probable phosphoglycerate mutase